MGNLHEISLAEAWNVFTRRVAKYLADKHDKVNRGEFTELDHFPCWYCVKYLGKAPGVMNSPDTLGTGVMQWYSLDALR